MKFQKDSEILKLERRSQLAEVLRVCRILKKFWMFQGPSA